MNYPPFPFAKRACPKKALLIALTFAFALSINQADSAPSITGNISFGGSAAVTLAGPITTLTFFNPQTVQSASGSFPAALVGSPATFAPLSWFGSGSSAVLVSQNSPEWLIAAGGSTYSFDLLTTNFLSASATSVSASGSGLMNITGFNSTPYNWVITANQVSNPITNGPGVGLLSVTATFTPAAVPEGGARTAFLLSVAVALLLLTRTALVGARRSPR